MINNLYSFQCNICKRKFLTTFPCITVDNLPECSACRIGFTEEELDNFIKSYKDEL